MHIFATFEHTTYLELAIAELELRGVAKSSILAVPLERQQQEIRILDTIHRADGVSGLDGSMVFATIGSVLGTIYGFVLPWGPVICGLVGMLLGFAAGLTLYWSHARRWEGTPAVAGKQGEVVLVVSCESRQVDMVKKILQEHTAIGVGVWENNRTPQQGRPAQGGKNQNKPPVANGSQHGSQRGSGGQKPPKPDGQRQPAAPSVNVK